MFHPTYSIKNEWHLSSLKAKEDNFKKWFCYRYSNGQFFCYISGGDHSVTCNDLLVGSADTLKELKREIRKWYKSI